MAELVGVQKTLSPVLRAKALDNRLPAPILGDPCIFDGVLYQVTNETPEPMM